MSATMGIWVSQNYFPFFLMGSRTMIFLLLMVPLFPFGLCQRYFGTITMYHILGLKYKVKHTICTQKKMIGFGWLILVEWFFGVSINFSFLLQIMSDYSSSLFLMTWRLNFRWCQWGFLLPCLKMFHLTLFCVLKVKISLE